MSNVIDGHATITDERGRSFEIAPSFRNMAKIGSGKEIINHFKRLHLKDICYISAFESACIIVSACGLDDIEYTGGVTFNEWVGASRIWPGIISPERIIILAEHCIKYGMTGTESQLKERMKDASESEVKSDDFDVDGFINNAVEFLGMDYDDAEDLTMVKYIRLCNARINAMYDRGELKGWRSKEDAKEAMDDHDKFLENYYEQLKKGNIKTSK